MPEPWRRRNPYPRSTGRASTSRAAATRAPRLTRSIARTPRASEYDRAWRSACSLGKDLSAADYVDLGLLRAAFQREVGAALEPFDAFVLPTVPCIAPPIAEVDASDEAYFRWNMRILGIVGLVNFLDGCAASLPCHARGAAPVGLMVCGPAMSDRRILRWPLRLSGRSP